MNRNREQIMDKIAEIMKQERTLGVKIDLEPERILDFKQNVIFYGGYLGSITIGKWSEYYVEICAVGEIYADLFRHGEWVRSFEDKSNSGYFSRATKDLIHSDEEYESMVHYEGEDPLKEKQTALVLPNDHHWLKASFYKRDDTWGYDEIDVAGSIGGFVFDTGDVLEAFDDVQSFIELIQEYEKGEGK